MAQEEREDVREQSRLLQQHPPHPVRKGQYPLPAGHVRQHPLHQVRRRHLRPLRVTGGAHPSPLAREGDEKAVWRGCPSLPRTAPSPPAVSAGTPTRDPPPAPPHQSHLAMAHATVSLPRASREPWETGEPWPVAARVRERLDLIGLHVSPVCPASGERDGTRGHRVGRGRDGMTNPRRIKAIAGNSASCLGFSIA